MRNSEQARLQPSAACNQLNRDRKNCGRSATKGARLRPQSSSVHLTASTVPCALSRTGRGLTPIRLLTCRCGIAWKSGPKWEVLGNAHSEDTDRSAGNGDRHRVLAAAPAAGRDSGRTGLAAAGREGDRAGQGQEESQEEEGQEGQEEGQEGQEQGRQLRHLHVLQQEGQEVHGRAQQEVARTEAAPPAV